MKWLTMTTEQLISVTNLEGLYTYVNDAFCEQSAYTREELLGNDSHQITHSLMPKTVLSEISTTLSKGLSWQGVMPIQSKEKQAIWLDTFITPQYENNVVVGYQTISNLASPELSNNAQRIYQAINNDNSLPIFELTKNHKFIFLVLLSLISQFFISMHLGWMSSAIAACSAMAPILVFWHDIIPTAFRAQKMQNTYDSVSRKVYFGRGTASVFDFNFSMIKTKLKAILERTIDTLIIAPFSWASICQGTMFA